MNECDICTETFNKSSRKPIECLYCKNSYCISCCKNYILTQDYPKCMNPKCQSEWNNEFIQTNFSLSFYKKEYKEHQKEILSSREKAKFQEMQGYLDAFETVYTTEKEIAKHKNEMRELRNRLSELDLLTWNLSRKRDAYRSITLGGDINTEELQKIEDNMNSGKRIDLNRNTTFIQACKVNGCRGFLSTKWVCTVCGSSICPECHEVKRKGRPNEQEQNQEEQENHVCDPVTVESIKSIQKDAKNCPKCASLISRISGCSQMWCTVCKISFDWNTLKVITKGNIHNPHYFEWVRTREANQTENVNYEEDENLCNEGVPNINELFAIEPNFKKYKLNKILRFIGEYDDVRAHVTNPEVEYRVLRIHYLRNYLNDKQFRDSVYTLEKKIEKDYEYRQILEMMVHVGSDIFRNWLKTSEKKSQEEYSAHSSSLYELLDYTNVQLDKYSRRWGISQKYINYNKNGDYLQISTRQKNEPCLPIQVQLGIKPMASPTLRNIVMNILTDNSYLETVIRKYVGYSYELYTKVVYIEKFIKNTILNYTPEQSSKKGKKGKSRLLQNDPEKFDEAVVIELIRKYLPNELKSDRIKKLLETINEEAEEEYIEIENELDRLEEGNDTVFNNYYNKAKTNPINSKNENLIYNLRKSIILHFRTNDFISNSKNEKRYIKTIEELVSTYIDEIRSGLN